MADTLLLADPNPTMQRVVELTCAEQGLKVVSVSDGQQALDYLVAEQPALALISVTLQKLDGFEIARLVRDRPDLQGIPVLLLAGAFETIDEARVRESGAAGVLVKPFEPGLVIKRVKELLGMSKPDGRPAPARPPQSQSGRLVTSAEAPVRPADEPPEAADATPPGESPRPAEAGTWEELREASGLGPDAAAVETPEGGEDYFGKLDAAFESLDAQLAGRSGPAGRATNPPPPRIPTAMDSERRPTPPPLAPPNLHDQLAAQPEVPGPVFEVDDNWFGKNAASSVKREEVSDFSTFDKDAPDAHGAPSAQDAQGAQGAPEKEKEKEIEGTAGAIDWRALHDDVPGTSVYGISSEAEPQETPGTEEAPPTASAVARERLPATYGEISPAAAGFPAADAFAMLWAHEQGEPLPPVPPLPPMELSDQTVEAVAQRTTEQLTERVTGDLASRVTDGLAARITEDLARRISNDLAQQFGDPFAERLAGGIASGLTDAVSDRIGERLSTELGSRITEGLGERLTTELSARVSAGLAEQIAAHVAERMMQHAFGDSLRQIVHDVSERLVREEIARIRAAAKDSPLRGS